VSYAVPAEGLQKTWSELATVVSLDVAYKVLGVDTAEAGMRRHHLDSLTSCDKSHPCKGVVSLSMGWDVSRRCDQHCLPYQMANGLYIGSCKLKGMVEVGKEGSGDTLSAWDGIPAHGEVAFQGCAACRSERVSVHDTHRGYKA